MTPPRRRKELLVCICGVKDCQGYHRELNYSRNVWWNKNYAIERSWLGGKPVGGA